MATPTRDIWTRIAIDPLADPLAARLAHHTRVTPNRITIGSGLLGVAAIACLATGQLRIGGLLFLLRFLADCLDGKVARLQGTSSARGALLDVATDVVCVVGAYAALAGWLVSEGDLAVGWAFALLAAVGIYGWGLAHRKHLAAGAGMGTGGSRLLEEDPDDPHPAAAPLAWWLARCRRWHMRPVPWSVEAETLALGLLPLCWPDAAAAGLLVALAFYVLACAVNLRRAWRLAALSDRPRRTDVADHARPDEVGAP